MLASPRPSVATQRPDAWPDLAYAPRSLIDSRTLGRAQEAIAAEKTALILTDPDRMIQWTNGAFERQTGPRMEDLRSRQLDPVFNLLLDDRSVIETLPQSLAAWGEASPDPRSGPR